MKKILLSAFTTLALQAGFCQTTATNFTCNDCTGANHDLFTELNAGKVIVLDWVMPCASCIAPSVSAYNIVQGFQTSHPGRVFLYTCDDLGTTACSTIDSWCNTNNMPNSTRFSNSAIKMTDYGTSGMPKIVVLGGTSHTVYYNANNSINTTTFTAAINSALNATTGISEINNSFSSLNLYPNPADNKTVISYSNENAGNVKIELFNLVGEKLFTAFSGVQNSGDQTVSVDTQKLSNGIYFIKLSAGNTEKTIKLSVAH